jgi:hypothetical protein
MSEVVRPQRPFGRRSPRHRWDPRRVVDALDAHAARRVWGRWPVVRVLMAYGIWFTKYGFRRGR